MKLLLFFSLVACFFTASLSNAKTIRSAQYIPSLFSDGHSFSLFNAAQAGLNIPAIGFGTGFYGGSNEPYGTYPECGAEPHNESGSIVPPYPGCGPNTQRAVYTWLSKAGGVRLDCANSYYNHHHVALGIEQSGVDRSQIFILTKVGPSFPLGYNDTIEQTMEILQQLRTTWIDMLLVHWPIMGENGQLYTPPSSDPVCNVTNPSTYSEKGCRLSTWSAMLLLFNRGLVRSIGVSNYNITHLQEIIDAGLPLPSANQVSFNPYNYRTGRADLLAFCQKNKIQLIAYSPLGVPDVHKFPVQYKNGEPTGMATNLLQDPVIVALANTYNRTSAQILLRWIYQLGVVTNPRSMSETHMKENLDILLKPFTISDDDMARITNLAQDTCEIDSDCIQPYFPSQIVFSLDNGTTIFAIDEINQRAYKAINFNPSLRDISYVEKNFTYSFPDSPESKYYVQLFIDSLSEKCMYGTYWKYGGNNFNTFPSHWWFNEINLRLLYYPRSTKINVNQSSEIHISLTAPPHRIHGNDTVCIQWKETQCDDCVTWTPKQLSFNSDNFQQKQILTVTRVKDGHETTLIPIFYGGGFDFVPPEIDRIHIQ